MYMKGVTVDWNLISFDFAALLIILIILFSTVVRRLTRGYVNVVFIRMLLFTMFTCLVQCLANVADVVYTTRHLLPDGTLDMSYHMPIWRTWLAYCYYGTRHLTPVYYLCYTIALTNTMHVFRRHPAMYNLVRAPAILSSLLVLTNPVTHLVFSMENYGSSRGPLMVILYGSAFMYILFNMFYIIYWRKALSRVQFISLMSFFPLNMIAVLLQFAFRGLHFEMFMTSITMLLLATVSEPPERQIDELAGVGSYAGYRELIRTSLLTKASLSLTYLQITNYETIMVLGSKARYHEVLKTLAAPLLQALKPYGVGNAYYLRDGLYCCDVRDGDPAKAYECASALRSVLAGTHAYGDSEITFEVSAVTVQVPTDVDDMETLQRFVSHYYTLVPADAKIVSFEELETEHDFRLKADIDNIISEALIRRSFKMYLQPIYNVRTRRFESAEALIRLIDDEYGFVSPAIFIPEAESTGQIMAIGDFVLDETMEMMARNDVVSLGVKYVEINLSVEQCIRPNVVDKVRKSLTQAGLEPSQVNLEITETVASHDLDAMGANVRRLRDAGFSLSLDDYGTGYSNIVRFTSLPFDIVKIDKTLIDNLGQREMDIIISSTIDSMHAIRRTVLAEGVETAEQAQALIEMGIDYIQGFYYARPMPEDEFVRFVAERNEPLSA